MKNMRLYSRWPKVHDDFEMILGFTDRGKRGGDNKRVWKDYDFGILNVSQKIVDVDDPSPQDRCLVRGIDRSAFDGIDYKVYTWMESAQPNVRTEAIIYCYERLHK